MELSAIQTTVAVLVGALAVTAALSTAAAQAQPDWEGFMWPGGHQHYHCSIHHGEFCVYDGFPVDCTGDAGEVVRHGETSSADGVEVRSNDGNMCVEATGSCVSSPAREVPGGMGPNRYNTDPVGDGAAAASSGAAP